MFAYLKSFFVSNNLTDYDTFYNTVDKEKILEKYTLLTYLNKKYNLIYDSSVYIRFEFNLFLKIMNHPNCNPPTYDDYINNFENLKLNYHRTEITINYLCGLFDDCIEGKRAFSQAFYFIGKKNLNKHMRRMIFNRLNHISPTTNTEFSINQQAAIKLYIRFMILSGMEHLLGSNLVKQIKALEPPNKFVKNINIEVHHLIKKCNVLGRWVRPIPPSKL